MIDFGHCFWLPPSLMKRALRANWRDGIFDYLLENLPGLQQLSETNQTALSQFNAEHVRRKRLYWHPPRIAIQVLMLDIT
jgi:hypothetical protein